VAVIRASRTSDTEPTTGRKAGRPRVRGADMPLPWKVNAVVGTPVGMAGLDEGREAVIPMQTRSPPARCVSPPELTAIPDATGGRKLTSWRLPEVCGNRGQTGCLDRGHRRETKSDPRLRGNDEQERSPRARG